MIVDCHTHVWQSPEQLGLVDLGEMPRDERRTPAAVTSLDRGRRRQVMPAADPDHHMAQSDAVDKSIVLGFKSRYLHAEIPNRFVADYVNRFPHKLIGFAGIDPTESCAITDLRASRAELRLRGITIAPAAQDFHPADSRAMALYAEAERLDMPILVHSAGQGSENAKLEFARPYLFDEVCRNFPRLRLIIAQLGEPWAGETLCMLARHANLYADISGTLARPWQAYNALVLAHQSGVIDKLLFGSDFPYTNAARCIESLYSLNQFAVGTNLPVIPRQSLRGIVERDSLALLGLS